MQPTDDRTALALTAMGEARGQGIPGMTNIINVVMNRVRLHSWRGLTPMEVCLKPWQFSCWNKGDPNRDFLLALADDDATYIEALNLADQALAFTLPDRTGGATYYYAASMKQPPKWAIGRTPCYRGEHQFFYNNID